MAAWGRDGFVCRVRTRASLPERERHLHAELARVDPESAERIHPNDPQRIQRALEVYELTGVPLSQQQTGSHDSLDYECLTLV